MGAHLLSQLPLHWIASPSSRDRVRQPLPLALFNPPCGCQTPGLEALERAGRPWRVAMTSPSLTGLWAAVSAGLGLTTRAELGLPADVQTKHPLGPAATGKYPHRASTQTQPSGSERDAVRRNHRGVGRYLSSFTPERETTRNRTLPCRSRDGW